MGISKAGSRDGNGCSELGAFLFGRKFPSALFVEPGDSLHVAVDEGFFGPSYSFSGSNADNSRFTSKWFPRNSYSLRLDRDAYKGLGVEDFKRLIEQWRRDQFEFLAEGREQYALSSGCIDYVTASVNYEWANKMVDYPSTLPVCQRTREQRHHPGVLRLPAGIPP